MAKQKDKFLKGAAENGLTPERAQDLFKLIEPFAAYGFNKAHAASYGLVAYQTAYMKANYPVEFMAALMTAEYGDTEKIARAIDECKRMGIAVLPPDVNYSEVGFTIENVADLPKEQLDRAISKAGEGKDAKQAIRFGLSAIKNVGIGAIESIMKAREKRPFKNLADLCGRIDTRLVNRRTLESLVKAGALDSFGARAPQLLVMDKCLEDAHKAAKLTAKRRQIRPIVMSPAPAILCRSLMSAAPNDATKTKNPMTMMTKLITGGATRTVPATISKSPMSAHRVREAISLLTLSNFIPVPLSRIKRTYYGNIAKKPIFLLYNINV
jgi:DNA polymerase III alpha subunit